MMVHAGWRRWAASKWLLIALISSVSKTSRRPDKCHHGEERPLSAEAALLGKQHVAVCYRARSLQLMQHQEVIRNFATLKIGFRMFQGDLPPACRAGWLAVVLSNESFSRFLERTCIYNPTPRISRNTIKMTES